VGGAGVDMWRGVGVRWLTRGREGNDPEEGSCGGVGATGGRSGPWAYSQGGQQHPGGAGGVGPRLGRGAEGGRGGYRRKAAWPFLPDYSSSVAAGPFDQPGSHLTTDPAAWPPAVSSSLRLTCNLLLHASPQVAESFEQRIHKRAKADHAKTCQVRGAHSCRGGGGGENTVFTEALLLGIVRVDPCSRHSSVNGGGGHAVMQRHRKRSIGAYRRRRSAWCAAHVRMVMPRCAGHSWSPRSSTRGRGYSRQWHCHVADTPPPVLAHPVPSVTPMTHAPGVHYRHGWVLLAALPAGAAGQPVRH
jgi:hypothetical protein